MLAAVAAAASNDGKKYNGRLEPNESSTETTTTTTPRVLAILSFVLERLVARNDQLVIGLSCGSAAEAGRLVGKSLSVFHGVRAPNISIPKYLERIYKYTNCSPSCFVVGYVYIDRLVHRHPDSLVISLNIHRLLVTSVMVASKMLDDVHYNNAFYAKVGGLSNAELNRLELELLFLLDFEVMVRSKVFESYCFHLEKEMMWNNNNNDNINGVGQKIEKTLMLSDIVVDVDNNDHHVTEISMEDEDTQTCSPPPQVMD